MRGSGDGASSSVEVEQRNDDGRRQLFSHRRRRLPQLDNITLLDDDRSVQRFQLNNLPLLPGQHFWTRKAGPKKPL